MPPNFAGDGEGITLIRVCPGIWWTEASSSLACRRGVCPRPVLTLGGPEEGPGDTPLFLHHEHGPQPPLPRSLDPSWPGDQTSLAPAPWRSPWWSGQEGPAPVSPARLVP